MATKKRILRKGVRREDRDRGFQSTLKSIGDQVGDRLGTSKQLSGINRAKLLVSIINQHEESCLKDILDDCSAVLSYRFAGVGTAHSELLDYLGIGETEKTVLLSVFPESDEELIIREIREKLSLYLVGKGISFTIPLAGISQLIAGGITNAATNRTVDRSMIMKREDRKYNLIVAAVAANYVDIAMDAARSAGATGGTIVRSRSMKNAKAEQFIGISLAQEQEILLILTRKEVSMAIMEALLEKVGAQTEAGGVIFSLPVDRTAGISAKEEDAFTATRSK